MLDQGDQHLEAAGNVSTRIPRETAGRGVKADDFIQIAAASLDYSGQQGTAVYVGQVRVRMAEGWMEAERIEVRLADEGSGVREIRAFDKVRLEFRQPTEDGPPRLISGTADRLVYTPPTETVWLYGDDSPATVRRVGESGETTRGRKLRYQLDSGALQVDSGTIQAAGS